MVWAIAGGCGAVGGLEARTGGWLGRSGSSPWAGSLPTPMVSRTSHGDAGWRSSQGQRKCRSVRYWGVGLVLIEFMVTFRENGLLGTSFS